MVYTHYWNWEFVIAARWEPAWRRLIEDTKAIVSAAEISLSKSGSIDVLPVIDVTDGIHLNGVDGDASGDFCFDADTRKHGNCKTARKPYDLVVTAILLRAWMLFDCAISIRSDGHWDDWEGARNLVSKLWPEEEITCPIWINEDLESRLHW